MQGFGLAIVGIGIWLMYCGVGGLDPFKTVVQIIRNPAQAQEIIAGSKKDTAPNSVGGAVVAFARAQIGKPYQFGAEGPNAFDCSGLTQAAYKSVGIDIPRLAGAQLAVGARVSRVQDLQPGDLVFPSLAGVVLGDHVQIYAGNGRIIEAPRDGIPVRERGMWGVDSNHVYATRPYKKA